MDRKRIDEVWEMLPNDYKKYVAKLYKVALEHGGVDHIDGTYSYCSAICAMFNHYNIDELYTGKYDVGDKVKVIKKCQETGLVGTITAYRCDEKYVVDNIYVFEEDDLVLHDKKPVEKTQMNMKPKKVASGECNQNELHDYKLELIKSFATAMIRQDFDHEEIPGFAIYLADKIIEQLNN